MNYKLNETISVCLISNKEYNKMMAGIMINAGANDSSFYLNNELVTLPDGIAHFLEHKTFETKNGDASLLFSKLGANSNAFTSYDNTAYYFTTTKNKEACLELLLDMTFNPYYQKKSVDNEKNIIIQELEMFKDMPDVIIQNQIIKNLFSKHPISKDIGGTKETVLKTTKKDLDLFHNAFYNTSFISIVVVGNFDSNVIKNIIDNYDYPKLTKEIKRLSYVSNYKVTKSSKKKLDVNIGKIGYGLRLKNIKEDALFKMKANIALQILLHLYLGDSSKLYYNLLETNVINEAFYYEISLYRDANFIIFLTDTTNYKLTKAHLKKAIKNLKNFQVKEKDFLRVKKMLLGKYYLSLNNLENILFSNLKNAFDLVTLEDILKMSNELKLEDLEIAKSYIDYFNLTEVIIFPKNE